MTRTRALVNNLLMSNLQWKSNLDNKSRTIEIVLLNTKWKDCKSRKNLCKKNFTYTKNFYVHEITAVNSSKIYILKNAKETCKPNNRDLNRDWIIRKCICIFFFCHNKIQPLTNYKAIKNESNKTRQHRTQNFHKTYTA